MFRLYEDLKIEIQAYQEQLEFAEDTKRRLERLLEIRKPPSDIRAMAFDNVGHTSRDDTTDDRTYARLIYTNKRIEAYREILEGLEKEKAHIESQLEQCKGIEYKVFYMSRIEGKTLWRISEELDKDYQYIKNISCKINSKCDLNVTDTLI